MNHSQHTSRGLQHTGVSPGSSWELLPWAVGTPGSAFNRNEAASHLHWRDTAWRHCEGWVSAHWLRTPCPSRLLCPLSPSACSHLSVSPSIMSRSEAMPCLVAWDPHAVFSASRLLNDTEMPNTGIMDHTQSRGRTWTERGRRVLGETSTTSVHVCLICPKD